MSANDGYKIYLDNGSPTPTEFKPLESLIVSINNDDGNFKRTVNDVEINNSKPNELYKYWMDNLGTPVYLSVVRLSDSFEQFRGQLRLKENIQSQKVLVLEASENNMLSQIEAVSSEAFNILTQSKVDVDFHLLHAEASTPVGGNWVRYEDVYSAVVEGYLLYWDLCIRYTSPTYRPDWSGTTAGYTGTPPVIFTSASSAESPLDYYFVEEIVEVPTTYLYVERSSITFTDAEIGSDFEYNAVSYTNGALLRTVIDSQLLKLPTPTTVKSTFLFGDAVETGNTWTDAEVNGHVPGVLQMHSVSDIKEPAASNPATIANISLGAILNTLKNVLKCYFFKDEDGFFRIEHVSYKRTGTNRDITTLSNVRKDPTLSYSDNSREKKINFQAVAAVNTEYVNTYIEYSDYDADPTKTGTAAYDSIIVDFQAAIDDSEKIPSDGILLVSKDGANEPTSFFEFQNIIENLWLHEANYSEFKIKNEGATITAESLAYVVKHEPIKIAESGLLFNELDLFETFYSATKLGVIESASIDTKTYQVEINLKFER